MSRSVPALLLLATLATTAASAQGVTRSRQAAGDSSASAAQAKVESPSDTGQSAAAGAPTVISGFVLDSMTNQPLEGAVVLLSGTSRTVTTDAGGRFRFELDSAASGTYTIGFFHPKLDSLGVTPPPRHIQVNAGGENFVEL